MHPLGRLITERMTLPGHGWSLAQVVARMKAAGHYGIGKSRLGQIRNDPIRSISRDVIVALAAGLGVTPLTVAIAALESMGIETRPAEVTDSTATIRIDPTLSEHDRRQLLVLIREMRTMGGVNEVQDLPTVGSPPSWELRGEETTVLGDENGQQRDKSSG